MSLPPDDDDDDNMFGTVIVSPGANQSQSEQDKADGPTEAGAVSGMSAVEVGYFLSCQCMFSKFRITRSDYMCLFSSVLVLVILIIMQVCNMQSVNIE